MIDKGRFTVRRAGLARAMISTPGHRLPEGANAGPCQPGRFSGSNPARTRRWRPAGRDTAIVGHRNFAIEHDLACCGGRHGGM
jgi:hypothetical protein